MAKKKKSKKKDTSWGGLIKSEIKGFGKALKSETKEWNGAAFRLGTGTKKPLRFSKKKK